MIVWLMSAFAGELEVERALTALSEGRSDVAVREAWKGVAEPGDVGAWSAWSTLIAACDAGGMVSPCRAAATVSGDADAELAATTWGDADVVPPDGSPERAVLSAEMARLAKADPDGAAARALEILGAHPEWPDLVIPILDPALPPQRAIAKARAKILKSGSKALGQSPSPALAYRWHRVFVAAASPLASRSADLLVGAGEPRPLDRRLHTRGELVTAAKGVLGDPSAPLPVSVPVEQEGFALRVAEMLGSAGRSEEGADVLARARAQDDTVSLALAQGEVLLGGSDWTQAAAIAEEALALAAAPWPSDLAVANRPMRKVAYAEALALRGRARLGDGDPGGAAVDLMIANQLVGTPLHGAELERAMAKGWFVVQEIKSRLETSRQSAAEVALAAAQAAVEAERWEDAHRSADEAVQVLSMPSQRKGRLTARLAGQPELARALALRGLAASRAGRSGVEDLTLAVLLLPWNAPSDWWSTLAELRSDQPWAGFFARAMADASSDAPDPAGLASSWPGTTGGVAAGPALVASWMAGDPSLEPPSDRLVVERGRVVSFGRGSGRGGGGVPRINEPYPAWSLDTGHGTVSWRPGRMVLLTFFRSDSANSLRAAEELTDLARALRGEGADIVWVGVAIDPERSTFDAIATRRDSWGDTGWDPGLGQRFGVSAVPTTWVLDSDGVARFQHVGYLGPSDYEAEVRIISGI